MEVINDKPKGKAGRAKKIETPEEVIAIATGEEKPSRRRAATKKPIVDSEDSDFEKSKAPKRVQKKTAAPNANGDAATTNEDAPKKGRGKKPNAEPAPATTSPKGKRGKAAVIPDEAGEGLAENAPNASKRGRGKVTPIVDEEVDEEDVPEPKRGRGKPQKINSPVNEPRKKQTVNKRKVPEKIVEKTPESKDNSDDSDKTVSSDLEAKITPTVDDEGDEDDVADDLPKRKRGKPQKKNSPVNDTGKKQAVNKRKVPEKTIVKTPESKDNSDDSDKAVSSDLEPKITPTVDDGVDEEDVPEQLPKRGRGKPQKINSPVNEPVKKSAVNKRKVPEKAVTQTLESKDEPESDNAVSPIIEVKAKRGKITTKKTDNEFTEDIPVVKAKKAQAVKKTVVDDATKITSEVPKKRGKKLMNSDENNENLANTNIPEEKLTKRGRKVSNDIIEEDDPKIKKRKIISKKATKETKQITAPKGKLNPTSSDLSKVNFDIKNNDWNFKISSWNVAGIRAWLQKGGLDYIDIEKPDIICLQETKCLSDDMPESATIKGYHPYWLCNKGGYAGVALYSKIMPMNIQYGFNDPEYDIDGRLMTAEYEKFFLVCVYVPNSGRKLVTLPQRMRWDIKFHDYLNNLDKQKPVILCGDMNVSHLEIDLANPKTNKRNAGFTQEERDGLSKLFSYGFVDTFRHLYPKREGAYTFWSYMGSARSKNVGWRLDYFILSERIVSKLIDNVIRSEIFGSDHCPIVLFLNI